MPDFSASASCSDHVGNSPERLGSPGGAHGNSAVERGSGIRVRLIEPGEYSTVAQQRLDAYRLDFEIGDDYAVQILDVARHAAIGEVWVAVDEESGELLGSVTTPRDHGQPLTPLARAGEFDFRLLAVAPTARGRGVGSILTEFVIELAASRGARRIVMNSGTEMTTAHGIYERRGFTRMPERENPPGIEPSRAYGMDLR